MKTPPDSMKLPAAGGSSLARAAKVCYAHFAATRRNRVAFAASPKPAAGLDSFHNVNHTSKFHSHEYAEE